MRLLNDKNNMLWAELLINQTKHGGRNTYAGYAFYCVYTLPVVRDKVSNEVLDGTGLAATRYDYDGGEFGAGEAVVEDDGCLTCGAYTNEITWSEDFSQSAWIKELLYTTQLANSINKLTPQTGETDCRLHQRVTSIDGYFTGSFEVKADGISTFNSHFLGRSVTAGSPETIYNIDLVNETVSVSQGNGSGDIASIGDDWYAIDLFYEKVNNTSTELEFRVFRNSSVFTGDGVKSILYRKVRLTATPYPMPYVKTEGAAVSVPENYSTTDQGPRFQIRDTGANEVYMPELLDALDGVADGEELVTDSSEVTLFGSGITTYFSIPCDNLIPGSKYEFSYVVVSSTLNGTGIGISTSSQIVEYGLLLTSTPGMFVFRSIAVVSPYPMYLYVSVSNTSGSITIKDFSVKEISPAQATIPYKWRPMFNAGDLGTTQNIVTANDEKLTFLYYDDVNEKLKASDGTNTSEVSCSPVADTEYLITVDYNATSGLQVSVDETAGTIVAFAGRIPVDDYLSHGWEAKAPQYVKQMTVEETS